MFRWRPAANRLAAAAPLPAQDGKPAGPAAVGDIYQPLRRVQTRVSDRSHRRPVQLGARWKAPSKAAPHSVRVLRPLICKLADRCIVCRGAKPRDD